MQACSGRRKVTATLASLASQIAEKPIEATPIQEPWTNYTWLNHHNPSMPKTQPLIGQPNQESLVVFEIRFRLALVIVMVTTVIGYKLIKYIYNRYFKYKIFIPSVDENGPSCKLHFYLEVYTDNDSCLLYMRSIKGSFMNLTLDTRATAQIVGISRHLFYDALEN